MLINADFTRVATSLPKQQQWVKSPQKGIERIMLDRVGAEKARATSFVRYAPQSDFPHHRHPGGEEIFVLAGTFSADDKHYPAGWYLRNPPASGHRPCQGSRSVCQLFASDYEHVSLQRLDAGELLFTEAISGGAEIMVLAGELYADGETFSRYSWIRLPTETPLEMVSGPSGATVYIKTGHLAQVIGVR
ncbi:cupin domain-containing protein [Psychrobacter halodurans]|uniref:Cupin domain-containing protein n=1 Tax=Psychrobacter halodurans TaxID=2818439 RepID=A0AAW4IW25_9GAMM|nr:cupin domain-containing protein [Psychrobacter halodurans]MBO1517379.1 cupin domain-containing protein [Psychrobacter halodurans]